MGLTRSFSKKFKLRSRHDFKKLHRAGSRFEGNFFYFQWMIEEKYPARLGMTISKKFGNAVMRNLLKRRLREVFRKHYLQMPSHLSINVFPKQKGHPVVSCQILLDFMLLIEHIQLLHAK